MFRNLNLHDRNKYCYNLEMIKKDLNLPVFKWDHWFSSYKITKRQSDITFYISDIEMQTKKVLT